MFNVLVWLQLCPGPLLSLHVFFLGGHILFHGFYYGCACAHVCVCVCVTTTSVSSSDAFFLTSQSNLLVTLYYILLFHFSAKEK